MSTKRSRRAQAHAAKALAADLRAELDELIAAIGGWTEADRRWMAMNQPSMPLRTTR